MRNPTLVITPLPIRTRDRILTLSRMRANVLTVIALLVITMVGTRDFWWGGTMIGMDSASYYYPMYSFLGERLRSFDLPGWNPAQLSGAPFAADPQSGWMYLPAMLFFSLLPLSAAIKSFVVFHFALAALTTYAFAKRLGMTLLGALMAAIAYEFSSFFVAVSVLIPGFIEVMAWIPLTLLGFDLALRGRSWLTRATWWGITGLALGQILAAWLGQGAYYAFLLFGSYALYRAILAPPLPHTPIRVRLIDLGLHAGAPVLAALAFAAAGILPRVEYVLNSTLAHGYQGTAAGTGGWSPLVLLPQILARGMTVYYVGIGVLLLAVCAFKITRRTYSVPFFTALSIGTLVLTLRATTPLHQALYLVLPGFENLHRHYPDRIMMVFYLGPALLAGATISALRQRTFLSAALVLLGAAELISAGSAGQAVANNLHLEPNSYFAPPAAVRALNQRSEGEPYRYVGYDPALRRSENGQPLLYCYGWFDERTTDILALNQATLFGLENIQGYNPIESERYSKYITKLNGQRQDYHAANLLSSGLSSPLLNLLNVRYLIIPAEVPPGRPDLLHLSQRYATVYADTKVRILENAGALPRAWLVNQAQQATTLEALDLLASGRVDPRQTALIESVPPVLDAPAAAQPGQATVDLDEPDRMRIDTRSQTSSLLMLSETYYPAWRAYVDGKRAPVYAADGTLRAIAVPAGTHTVELRYESATLRLGLVISLVAYLMLAVILIALWRSWRGKFRKFAYPLLGKALMERDAGHV